MNTTNMNARKRIDVRSAFTAAFAAACLSMAATVCHATDGLPGNEPAKKVVQYGDLNLSNATAVQRLYHRIVSAAQEVCGDRQDRRSLQEQVRARICVEHSIERAVTAVNHPALTTLYAAKTGRSMPPSTALANRR